MTRRNNRQNVWGIRSRQGGTRFPEPVARQEDVFQRLWGHAIRRSYVVHGWEKKTTAAATTRKLLFPSSYNVSRHVVNPARAVGIPFGEAQVDHDIEQINGVPERLGGEVEVAVLEGVPMVREALLLHRPTGAVLSADLLLAMDQSAIIDVRWVQPQ